MLKPPAVVVSTPALSVPAGIAKFALDWPVARAGAPQLKASAVAIAAFQLLPMRSFRLMMSEVWERDGGPPLPMVYGLRIRRLPVTGRYRDNCHHAVRKLT